MSSAPGARVLLIEVPGGWDVSDGGPSAFQGEGADPLELGPPSPLCPASEPRAEMSLALRPIVDGGVGVDAVSPLRRSARKRKLDVLASGASGGPCGCSTIHFWGQPIPIPCAAHSATHPPLCDGGVRLAPVNARLVVLLHPLPAGQRHHFDLVPVWIPRARALPGAHALRRAPVARERPAPHKQVAEVAPAQRRVHRRGRRVHRRRVGRRRVGRRGRALRVRVRVPQPGVTHPQARGAGLGGRVPEVGGGGGHGGDAAGVGGGGGGVSGGVVRRSRSRDGLGTRSRPRERAGQTTGPSAKVSGGDGGWYDG
jgi:hypothetical protein